MLSSLGSLAVIMLVAALSPYVASLIPGRAVPEVVFLVFAGAVLGPNALGVISTDSQALTLVSDVGVGLLFMLAGYEIQPDTLRSRSTAHAVVAWAVSLALGVMLTTTILAGRFTQVGKMAFAICLTTTAYGTLAPILRDRGVVAGTPAGDTITVYGALGELLPILAMAILLSARQKVESLGVLALFVAACVAILVLPRLFPRPLLGFGTFLKDNAWSGSRPLLRVAVLLLVVLLALSEYLGLDLVLGAFAAGFLLRALAPRSGERLADQLGNFGNGFMIPCYFVISGAKINLGAAGANFGLVMGFVGLLALVRGGVVAVSLNVNPKTRKSLSAPEKFSVSAYCTMALPLVVAVTDVAVSEGAMSQTLASILVTAGAVTVVLIPIATSFARVANEAHPLEAVHEVVGEHHDLHEVVQRHLDTWQSSEDQFRHERERLRSSGRRLSSSEYLIRDRRRPNPDARRDASGGRDLGEPGRRY